MNLSIAYSPCPNDTFIFYALAHRRIDCGHLTFSITLADVETLNQKALQGIYDISKLSFAAVGRLRATYRLLQSGAALGRGCGPLIVAKPGADIRQLRYQTIAVPGINTTAYLLLGLFLEKPPTVMPMPFDRIMPAVAGGQAEFGVIIHEGRFTYPQYGLIPLIDLGEWWEQKTGLPIPLGGIAVRRNLSDGVVKQVETAIRESIQYAFRHPDEAEPYIRQHAQEMEHSVIRRHIGLYVNEFTKDLGTEGRHAVKVLFEMAQAAGMIAASVTDPEWF